jgi:two-component system, NarL family, response regulator DegU
MSKTIVTSRVKPIRIAAADSSQMACQLLSEALNKQPGLSVVASAVDYDSLRRLMERVKPDVALIGAGLQGSPLSTKRGTADVSSSAPPCPWVLLLDKSEPHLVVAAFRAGAKGVFSRSQSDISLLAKCVRRVTEGQIWADNRQMLCLLEAFTGKDNGKQSVQNASPRLTAREESVVRLVMLGMVNREIANELHLSEHTVKNYLFRIFDKLGVSNRVELALYAAAKLNPMGSD